MPYILIKIKISKMQVTTDGHEMLTPCDHDRGTRINFIKFLNSITLLRITDDDNKLLVLKIVIVNSTLKFYGN